MLPRSDKLLWGVGSNVEHTLLTRGVRQKVFVQTAGVESNGSPWVNSRTVGAAVLKPDIS